MESDLCKVGEVSGWVVSECEIDTGAQNLQEHQSFPVAVEMSCL